MAERGRDGRFRRTGTPGTTGKLSAERKAAILAGLELGLSRSDAAQSAGVHRRTVNYWAAEDPEFADALEMAESHAKRHLVGMVVSVAARMLPNTWQAAAWLLERRWPEQFGQRARMDVSLDMEAEIAELAAETGVRPEELKAEAEAILMRHARRATDV